jgi:hypothetical protein
MFSACSWDGLVIAVDHILLVALLLIAIAADIKKRPTQLADTANGGVERGEASMKALYTVYAITAGLFSILPIMRPASTAIAY